MSLREVKRILIIALFLSLAGSNIAQAGFGIAPPYVRNDMLARGSHYEQKILLIRGDPVEDLRAEITVDIPGIDDWISIDKGMEFILPKGEKKVPMVVNVDVPQDVKFGNYEGAIRIRVVSLAPLETGTVNITLGGQIDVRLNVTDIEIFDFLVRLVTIPDSPEGRAAKILLKVENTGNIKSAPTSVHLDVYDSFHQDLLWSGDDSRLEKIKPFETKEIFAKFKTELAMGQYWADVKIFKGEEVAREEKVFFTITEKLGTLDSLKADISELPIWVWVITGIVVLAGIGYGGYQIWKKKKKNIVLKKEKKNIVLKKEEKKVFPKEKKKKTVWKKKKKKILPKKKINENRIT